MKITVYCGASLGNHPAHQEATKDLANWIVSNQHTLVYGGSRAGLMGLIADSVLAQGGKAIGIMPKFLQERELAHPALTEFVLVDTMAQRKAKMLELADACIALPGGPGTLEEITEVYSWARIGQNSSPCIFFNKQGFYNPVRQMYASMMEAGFLTQTDFDKLLFSEDLAEIEAFIASYQAPLVRTY
ncbi:Rossman fold protein, TIGR00730 family [Pasteurellaceae bacterium RH1A]|nr:Rossman fold protein, TIGR00730 family [Pasteurellaceae bacterium RH1A]